MGAINYTSNSKDSRTRRVNWAPQTFHEKSLQAYNIIIKSLIKAMSHTTCNSKIMVKLESIKEKQHKSFQLHMKKPNKLLK